MSYTWALDYPTLDEVEARSVMREMYAFWLEQAQNWTDGDYDVVDNGIDTNIIAGVHLYIDGFTIGASHSAETSLVLEGRAPCVANRTTEVALGGTVGFFG